MEFVERIQETFVCQGYPVKMIEKATDRVKNEYKKGIDWKEEKSLNPSRNFTLKIPYTGHRVQKICKDLRKEINLFLPEFNLHFAHKTITIRNTLLSHLSPKTEHKSNFIDLFV